MTTKVDSREISIYIPQRLDTIIRICSHFGVKSTELPSKQKPSPPTLTFVSATFPIRNYQELNLYCQGIHHHPFHSLQWLGANTGISAHGLRLVTAVFGWEGYLVMHLRIQLLQLSDRITTKPHTKDPMNFRNTAYPLLDIPSTRVLRDTLPI